MKMSDEFQSRYINAAKVDEWGGKVLVTIVGVDVRTFGVGANATKKAVLAFGETDLEWPANMTNRTQLVALFGDDTEDWIGRQITLSTAPDVFQGRPVRKVMCGSVNVRPPVAPQNQPRSAAPSRLMPLGPRTPPWQSVPAPPIDGHEVLDEHGNPAY